MPILTKRMRKYVLNETKTGYDEETKAKYKMRLTQYALRGLEDLTLLLERLPEDLRAKIFTEETLRPFFEKLFHLKIPAKDHQEYLKVKGSKEMIEKRKRLLRIAVSALNTIGNMNFAYGIVPEPMKPFMSGAGWPPLNNIKALFYTSLKEEEYLQGEGTS